VDIIAHPGNPYYPIEIDRLIQCAYDTGTLIEINNSSFIGSRKGSAENCKNIAVKAKKKGIKLAAGSDCHICFDVGKFNKVEEIFEEIGMPEELVINTDPQKLIDYLKKNGRKISM
jgi:putative hydrolase